MHCVPKTVVKNVVSRLSDVHLSVVYSAMKTVLAQCLQKIGVV